MYQGAPAIVLGTSIDESTDSNCQASNCLYTEFDELEDELSVTSDELNYNSFSVSKICTNEIPIQL